MIAPARRAALRALLAVHRGERDAPSAIADARRTLHDRRDLGLLNELVTGVLRWQAALDAGLDTVSNVALDRLDPAVRLSLRLGAYQLVFLTRVPPSAIVHDAVALVREAGVAKAAGYVNAVLRRVTPEGFRRAWPPRPAPLPGTPSASLDEGALDYLAVTQSHPRWLVERWVARLGFAVAEQWTTFNNTTPPFVIRPIQWALNRDELATELAAAGVTTEPGRWSPQALVVTGGAALQSSLAERGVFLAQDEASQLVAQLAADLQPASVLDVCASPGGKTTYLRGALPHATLVAGDHRARRVRLLRDTLQRTHANVPLVRHNASEPLPFRASFGLVLVDAPCSGLGTIRREPDIRWRRDPADLESFAAMQRRILHHAAVCVARGGYLVYATCSSEPEENEDVIESFLRDHHDFERLAPAAHPWRDTRFADLLDSRGDFRTEPHRHALEAFYAAVVVSREP